MVYILKDPVEDSKGIIIFRERGILETDNFLLKEQLKRLKSRYVIAYFWAWYQDEVNSIPFVDVHLAASQTVKSFNTNQRRIKVHDIHFVPDYFRNLNIPKRWDLLCIAAPGKHKRVSELLEAIEIALNKDPTFTALLLFPRPKKLKDEKWDEEFFKKYDQDFTSEQKENITLHTPLRTDDNIQPIPKEYLPYLYNSSKFFTLFSKKEGGPKVIAEALVCGTPVVVPSSFQGGICTYLEESNSRHFSSLEEASEIFIEMKNNSQDYDFDPDPLRKELVVSHTAEVLEKKFKQVFVDIGIPYEGNIDKRGLDSKVAHHKPTIPENYRKQPGRSELKSHTKAYEYIKYHIFDDNYDNTEHIKTHVGVKLPATVKKYGISATKILDRQVPVPIYGHSRRIYRSLFRR